MPRWLFAILLLGVTHTAQAAPFVLVFDGSVTFTDGSAPSLTSLGLSFGSPLHYEVRIDRDADGYTVSNGQAIPSPDYWNAPDDHADNFLAELLVQAYPTPGSYYDLGRESFVGSDVVLFAFDCDVLGRLFVGMELFHIDGCAPVAEWGVGFEVGSGHNWHDPDTGEFQTVYGTLRVTDVITVPEPRSAYLLALGLAALLAARRTGSV